MHVVPKSKKSSLEGVKDLYICTLVIQRYLFKLFVAMRAIFYA